MMLTREKFLNAMARTRQHVEEKMGVNELHVMNKTGHTTTAWDADNPDEVRVARATFDQLRAQGFQAFRVRGKDQQGERMDTFDPNAEQMIMVPQLRGG